METEVANDILRALEQAWNTGDGEAFGVPFTPDATFVTIRGELMDGPAIAPGHQEIFSTIYRGSMNRFTLLRARAIATNVIVAHTRAHLSVPAGPMAGEHDALASLVLVNHDTWQIVSFHNTLLRD